MPVGSMHYDGASMLHALYYSRDIYIAVGKKYGSCCSWGFKPLCKAHIRLKRWKVYVCVTEESEIEWEN